MLFLCLASSCLIFVRPYPGLFLCLVFDRPCSKNLLPFIIILVLFLFFFCVIFVLFLYRFRVIFVLFLCFRVIRILPRLRNPLVLFILDFS